MDNVISLSIGEPDFQTPWHIRDEGIRSLEKGKTWYSPNRGFAALLNEITAYYERRFGVSYSPSSQTIVTVGGSEAIDLALRCLVEPGDEVIIPQPSFVCYEPLTVMAGGTPVIINTKNEDSFRLKAADLEAAITPKTKLLVLPFPNNPTGAIMERRDLEEVAEVVRRHDLIVLSDEIYSELTYGGRDHVTIASIDSMYERTIVINGFSKSYAMTGWRLGYALGPAEIISQMTKLHQYGIMSAPTTAQYAAIEALKNGDRDVDKMRGEYDMRRRLVVDGFNEMGLSCFEPLGAFYVFPCIKSTGLSSEEFCTRLIMEKHVAVVPGTAFGSCGDGFVRVSYSYSLKHLKIALERIREFVKELRDEGNC
ncbi:MAG TPA: pyridoxal phosphate-dependent aminotransferase [Ruminococcaceae bacterium]|nr:pyridoxal phosphate-dependent aminotransferase [Oscillospiraceae bacterium]